MCRCEGSNGRKEELEAQQNELFCINSTSFATVTPGLLLFSFLIIERYGKKEISIAIPILEKKRKGLGTQL